MPVTIDEVEALHGALATGDCRAVERLLQAPDGLELLMVLVDDHEHPAVMAASLADPDLLTVLARVGVCLDGEDRQGRNLLHVLVDNPFGVATAERVACADWLIEVHGADPHLPTRQGWSPVRWAAWHGQGALAARYASVPATDPRPEAPRLWGALERLAALGPVERLGQWGPAMLVRVFPRDWVPTTDPLALALLGPIDERRAPTAQALISAGLPITVATRQAWLDGLQALSAREREDRLTTADLTFWEGYRVPLTDEHAAKLRELLVPVHPTAQVDAHLRALVLAGVATDPIGRRRYRS